MKLLLIPRDFFFVLRDPKGQFRHADHDRDEYEKIDGHDRKTDQISEKPGIRQVPT